ncbi:phosphatase PAP2 family protein [Bacteroides ovatus]|jgi:membrane-associated phospholipid phosphatase|uniref:phosphatase PAP2 family protein n=2 Tax=Bacteroides ovatus TaxID=28116 RepID=UPI0020A77E80|nr:phosphatase PAP2 family protein [Bacteroides ovatus]MDC2435624.1 phosphatase PAP2 family protein [Bacteroides ovatus]MDC2451434.1 phosphatase PAP2 family protein [Bacteroides ovatus]MDC2466789.1 phosphatase PAP2 family protein [Bacteroides ovatus]MDC2486788.1 phosphatase PAP2 family protein [Bacteroides ovatus]
MKRIVICIVGICSFSFLSAQNSADNVMAERGDSLRISTTTNFSRRLDKFSSSRFYQMTYIGVPLIVGGLIVKREDDHFRGLRNEYLPRFNRHLDDYMQYAPAAVMLGMKVAGVQSRSSWGRMLVSDAFSALLMGGVVNTLKQTTNVERPDGSNKHSFPSGHTATAFMTATMFTKEYGHKSPWVGVGAYSVATATGLMRMANNKHWLSDVLTGAGIGILSTEVGYYFADLIFREKGINRFANENMFDRMDKPSFVSLYLGLNIPLSGYDIDEEMEFRTSSGSSAGVEGAYFFNPYVGVGGRFTVSNTLIIVNEERAENNTFDAISLCGGSYFSYPLSSRWLIGSKLLGGYVHYPQLELTDRSVSSRSGFCMGSGVSLTFKAKEYYGIRFFLDYNLLPSHSRNSGEYMNMFTLGSSFMITF